MANLKFYLQEILDEKDMGINYLKFACTNPKKITETNVDDLLSKIETTLDNQEERFSVYDSSGQYFAQGLTRDEINKKMPSFVSEEQSLEASTSNQIKTTFLLCQKLNKKGYQVYGYSQELFDSWHVLEPELHVRHLAELRDRKTHEIDPVLLYAADERDADMPNVEIVDENFQPIMQRNTDKKCLMFQDGIYFDIKDINDTLIFKQLTIEQLTIVLTCLDLNIDLGTIYQMFLKFRPDEVQGINFTEIIFQRMLTSEKLRIKTQYDFNKLSRLEMDEFVSMLDGYYTYWNPSFTTQSERIVSKEEALYLLDFLQKPAMLMPDKKELAKLSQYLLEIANCHHYEIVRYDRQLLNEWFLDQVEYENNQITDFVRVKRSFEAGIPDNINPIERCFNLINTQTGELDFHDLSCYGLVSTLLGLENENEKEDVVSMKKNTQFNLHDSWAIWHAPKTDLTNATPEERQLAFGESYQPEMFPSDALPNDLDELLSQTKYVLIGLNPGNEGVSQENDATFLNFHGKKKSLDYRLAAALYGTEMWGAFMTDLVHVNESNSSDVSVNDHDVSVLEKHLDELSIPQSAVLVAMGTKSYDALQGKTSRRVVKLPHYSGANGHWKAEKTRQIILDIIASNQD